MSEETTPYRVNGKSTPPSNEEGGIVFQETSEFNIIFIHSKLDEIGLTANQFRIYAHLARRANGSGKAWPGIDSMAEVCKMSKNTVTEALFELEAMAMIEIGRTPGKRSVYRLTNPSKWQPSQNRERSDRPNPSNGSVPIQVTHRPNLSNVRVSIEGNPEKVIQSRRGVSYSDPDPEKPSPPKPKSTGEIQEVRDFCKEIGLPTSDGDYCFYKWESNGWTIGGKKIKCWKSAIRSWRAAGHLPSQKQNGHSNGYSQPNRQSPPMRIVNPNRPHD